MEERHYPNITVVNESDQVIGYFQLFDALDKGLIRRISAVMLFEKKGRILIQRRAAHVLSPNLLDFSAAGHVNEGETYLSTAQAELFEELGVKDVVFEEVVPPFMTPGFFNGVFKTVISSTDTLATNPDEVANVFWVSYPELAAMIAQHPGQFSEPFLAVWPHIRDKIST